MKHPSQIRIWEPLLAFLLISVGIVYAIVAFNAQDWLWFQSGATDARPSRIVIVNQGKRTTLQPGHVAFAQLSEAVHASVGKVANTSLIDIGLSDESLAYFEDEGVLLELYYDQPVAFHVPFRVGKPTQLLIPIEGRHAGHNYFFRGANGEWWFGAMRMADSTPLYTTLQELGYIE
ncbi:MAG: hypothetical protein D6706_20720 [Chloroflexi bacterium]|nr:MAG: hypothetical protein D6706_20720 [Chloroflexota bacterium]